MNKAFEEILDKLKQIPNEYRHEEYNEAIRDVVRFIERYKEKYNNGWIPCSEQLPEKEGKYLVTLDKWNIVSFADFKNLKYNPHFNAPVIAWQPLPEPYKEK